MQGLCICLPDRDHKAESTLPSSLCNICAFWNWATASLSLVLWKPIQPCGARQPLLLCPQPAAKQVTIQWPAPIWKEDTEVKTINAINCPKNSARIFVKWEHSVFNLALPLPSPPFQYINYKWRGCWHISLQLLSLSPSVLYHCKTARMDLGSHEFGDAGLLLTSVRQQLLAPCLGLQGTLPSDMP